MQTAEWVLWDYSLNFVLPEVPVLLKIDVLVEFQDLTVLLDFLFILSNSKKYTFATEYYISETYETPTAIIFCHIHIFNKAKITV